MPGARGFQAGPAEGRSLPSLDSAKRYESTRLPTSMTSSPGPWRTRSLFLFLSFVWGFNFLFVRVGLAGAAPLWLAFLRAAVGAGATAVVLILFGPRQKLGGRGRRDAFLLGLPNTTAFYAFLMLGIQAVLPGLAAVLTYTFPLWVAILSPIVLGHRLSRLHWTAVAGGFLGVVLISGGWNVLSAGVSLVAVLELLGAAVSWAVGTVLFQRRFRREEMFEANAFQLFGGTAGLVALVGIFSPLPLPSVSLSLGLSVLWLGVLGTTLAYLVWFWLLGRTRAATLSAYVFLVPVVALGASAIVFGERLTLLQLAGVGLVFLSTYGISSGRGMADSTELHA